MKRMLLTAVAVGAVLAAMIVYNERKNRLSSRIEDAADDAYDTMNEGIGSIERPMQHAMG